MKLNPMKMKCIIISRSCSLIPVRGTLSPDRLTLNVSKEVAILGVIVYSNLTFKCHICSLACSVIQKLGIIRQAFRGFAVSSISATCFQRVMFPVLEHILLASLVCCCWTSL